MKNEAGVMRICKCTCRKKRQTERESDDSTAIRSMNTCYVRREANCEGKKCICDLSLSYDRSIPVGLVCNFTAETNLGLKLSRIILFVFYSKIRVNMTRKEK